METPLHGAPVARLQFQVGEPFQSSRRAEILFGGVLESLVELMAHGGKTEPVQFPGEGHDVSLSGSLSRNASYSSSESWSVASSLSRGSILQPHGRLNRTR